jgi:hypothetical protein
MSITNSTTHRVLCIPELLDMIFGFLDPPSNVENAQVCRTWLNVALDVLWKEVESPRRLFGLLAPLKETFKGQYVRNLIIYAPFYVSALSRNSKDFQTQTTGRNSTNTALVSGAFDTAITINF